jgi:lipopolysaccharide transport system ATP-binding protein
MKMETRIRNAAPMNTFINSSTHPLTNSSTPKTPIIQVKHLSKKYQIGMDRTYKTFCETAVDTLKSPLKRLKSFSRQEETFWALKDVNFEVYPGEVVGIIGRNGAGKSTLLKILSRITHPTEGEIILRGRVASLLEVGTGFHPELTGRENIYFNGAILGMTKQEIEDKFDEIVAFSGVKEFLDTPLKRYSSGMQVRLAFAVAAHLEPEILVVDEVLAVGDAEFQKKCLGKMSEVAKGGRTVLFVSHNLAAIQQLCPRGILLESGSIACDDIASTAVDYYLRSSVRELVSHRDTGNLPRRPGEGTRFRYTKVALMNRDARLKLWEPLQIVFEFECLDRVHDVVLGFTVMRMNGVAVFTTESEDVGLTLDLVSGQKGSIVTIIPHPNLAPGRYAVRVGARSGTKVVDWFNSVLVFDVDPGKNPYTVNRASTHGMCPQSSWEVDYI